MICHVSNGKNIVKDFVVSIYKNIDVIIFRLILLVKIP